MRSADAGQYPPYEIKTAHVSVIASAQGGDCTARSTRRKPSMGMWHSRLGCDSHRRDACATFLRRLALRIPVSPTQTQHHHNVIPTNVEIQNDVDAAAQSADIRIPKQSVGTRACFFIFTSCSTCPSW